MPIQANTAALEQALALNLPGWFGMASAAQELAAGPFSAQTIACRWGEDVLRLGEISAKCCERVQHVVTLLPQLNKASVAEAALKTCEEIDRLESDADRVMRSAMSKLFRDNIEVRELIKLKAVYEHLESISDRCEDVANIVEGIVLENS